MAISYLAVDGSSAVEESALADPGSLAQSSAIAININQKLAYRKFKLSRGSSLNPMPFYSALCHVKPINVMGIPAILGSIS